MDFDLQRVRANVRDASTEDLLDRATVYRAGLEPAALPVILEELRSRGVTPEDVVAHEGSREAVLFDDTGTAMTCQRCRKPAVVRLWGWHRMFGKLPVYPRPFFLCAEHSGREESDEYSMNGSTEIRW